MPFSAFARFPVPICSMPVGLSGICFLRACSHFSGMLCSGISIWCSRSFPFLYILYLTIFTPLPFLGSRAMFFFSLGAAYAIHRRDFTVDAERVAIPCAILWGIGVTIQLFKEVPFVGTLTTTLLIPVLVALASWGIRRGWWHPVPWLAASSFFVYFCHEFMGFRVAVDAVRTRLFVPYGDWACLGFILVNWIVGTALSLAAFLFLRRFLPRSLVVLAGLFPSKHR